MVPKTLQKLGGDSILTPPPLASIGSPLICKELTLFLKNNLDLFAWRMATHSYESISSWTRQLGTRG